MRILLVTTGGNNNPGDQFIRLGVEALIRAVWPTDQLPPELVRVDKESDDIGVEQPFDRAILCGMPLWWNNDISKSQDIGWWGPIMRGWISAERRKFLILGAGPVCGPGGFTHPAEVLGAMIESRDRAWAVTSRQPLNTAAAPGILESVCPAAFATRTIRTRWRRLANLMPEGAHDSHFFPRAAEEWKRRLPDVSKTLLPAFDFMAHSADEAALAKSLGWPAGRIHFPETPEKYLAMYAETKVFFGNRLHGAMVVAAGGGAAVAVGYDSRMRMLRPFTSQTWGPFGVPRPLRADMLEHLTPTLNRAQLAAEWTANRELVRRFLFENSPASDIPTA